MVRFVPRGLAAQDRLSTTPCAAPTLNSLRQLHVCASAQVRGVGRDLSALDECAVAPFVWICLRFVSHGHDRQDRFSAPSHPQCATPCPEVVVLGARPPWRRSRQFGGIRAADSCSAGTKMHMGGGQSCTKFKNWNRPPERPGRGLRARKASAPLGTRCSSDLFARSCGHDHAHAAYPGWTDLVGARKRL